MPDPNFDREDATIVITNTSVGGVGGFKINTELFDQVIATLVAGNVYDGADSKIIIDTDKIYFGYDVDEFQRLFGEVSDILTGTKGASITKRNLQEKNFALNILYTPSPPAARPPAPPGGPGEGPAGPGGGPAASAVSSFKEKIHGLKESGDMDNEDHPDHAPPM